MSFKAVKVPAGGRQTLHHNNRSREEVDVPLGTTAFVSGRRIYKLNVFAMRSLNTILTFTYLDVISLLSI